jgi:hypothetical protein
MTITTYSTLVDAIADRMNDSALDDYAPEFIQMAEAMFNRRLANLEAEGTATIPAEASLSLPTDFVNVKSIYLDTDPRVLLAPMSADNIRYYWAAQTTGKPQNYALSSNEIILGPSPDDDYTVTMTYVRSLTGLSSTNATNWLLEAHPDLYLYGSLIHAEFRGWNDERLPMLNNAVEGIITEINIAGNRRRIATGMRMRPSVVERI